MKLSVCLQAFHHLDFDHALAEAAAMGIGAVEIPVDARSPFAALDRMDAAGARELERRLRAHGMAISAISNHQEGQLFFGPHHADTDAIFAGTPEEKKSRAEERLRHTARLAADLGVPHVIAFLGCEDYTRHFPWPDPQGWERMVPEFVDRTGRLLDDFDRIGVSLAVEPHPKQFIYDIETAVEAVAHLGGHRRLGFNLDPANLVFAGVDPVVFVAELGPRVLHVHAKDAEIVKHRVGRSGILAHGPWDRPTRGFRFRVPGWGDVDWKRLISELILEGYDGYLAIENEDPCFDPLDGVAKARDFLLPLLPRGRRRERWW